MKKIALFKSVPFRNIKRGIYLYWQTRTSLKNRPKNIYLITLSKLKRFKAERLLSKSLELSKEAQSLDPNTFDTNANLAIAYLSKGQPVEAWAYATKALKINPDNKWVWQFLYHIAGKSHGLLKSLLQTYEKGRIEYPNVDFFREIGFNKKQNEAITRGIPSLLINTQAKSGTVYIRGKFSQGLKMPWCRLTVTPLDNEPIQSWVNSFAKGGAVCGEHLFATDTTVARLQAAGIQKIVIHTRDPREAAFSMVHFRKKQSMNASKTNAVIGDHPVDISLENKFLIECCHFIPFWSDWLNSWIKLEEEDNPHFSILFTDYREFKINEEAFIKRILQFYEIEPEKFNFDISLKKAHKIHFRSGQLDEWRNLISGKIADEVWNLMDMDLCDRFDWAK